jgi:hypothetical protein
MLSTTPSDGDYSFVFTSRDVQFLHGFWPSGLVGSLDGWYKREISKKPINKVARGQIWRASSLLQIAPYWSETPVLRLVALPVCLNVVTHVTIDFWFGTRPNTEAILEGLRSQNISLKSRPRRQTQGLHLHSSNHGGSINRREHSL